MSPARALSHLTSRFFGVILSNPLGPARQDWVRSRLSPHEATLFWEQHPVDQRHAYDVAKRVQTDLGENQPAITAALLHDVGKRHSDVGPIGRSLATVFDALRLPLRADWRRYRDHGELGAADLELIGADDLSVAFARGRIDPAAAVDQSTWEALVAADDA